MRINYFQDGGATELPEIVITPTSRKEARRKDRLEKKNIRIAARQNTKIGKIAHAVNQFLKTPIQVSAAYPSAGWNGTSFYQSVPKVDSTVGAEIGTSLAGILPILGKAAILTTPYFLTEGTANAVDEGLNVGNGLEIGLSALPITIKGTNTVIKYGNNWAKGRVIGNAIEEGIQNASKNKTYKGFVIPNKVIETSTQQTKIPNSTYLGMLERPSKLSESERLGIPKGKRNQPFNISSDKDYGNIRFIRNLGEVPELTNKGLVWVAPENNVLVNTTTDLPFRLHSMYPKIPGEHYLLIHPRAFSGQQFLSIKPSDSFTINMPINPKYVRFISGNKDALALAKRRGMRTYTTDKLQELYDTSKSIREEEFKKGYNGGIRDFGNTDYADSNIKDVEYGILSKNRPEDTPIVIPYRKEVDRVISDVFKRPSFEDYSRLEDMTSLQSDVTKSFYESYLQPTSSADKTVSKDLFQNGVYYNTASPVEGQLLHEIGLWPNPKSSNEFERALMKGSIASFMNKIKSKPLLKIGGKLNKKGETE